MIAFQRLSLARQFMVASFPILLVGMLVIGFWVAREIERGVVNRLGAVTSLYVDSLVSPHLRYLLDADPVDAAHRTALDALLTDTPLGQKIIAFNIFKPDGRIVYSTNASVIGQTIPIGEGLATALGGEIHSTIIDGGTQPHGTFERAWPSKLIETYAPVHLQTASDVAGVAEFYQPTDELARETGAAQRRSWLVVAATMFVMYLVLFGLVRRGSKTIARQRGELNERVSELSTLLARNARLDARVRGAAARTTAQNEQFLRRISSDLHDGPGQDLGFAQMRLETLADRLRNSPIDLAAPGPLQDELDAIRAGLESAMNDLRSISAGLQLPELDGLAPVEVAARAVRDYERKSGATAELVAAGEPVSASLPVKITLYRLLQEALANGFRHAGAIAQRIELAQSPGQLTIEISDAGPGFDAGGAKHGGGIGLAGMRERVQSLGGSFDLRSTPQAGTRICVTLPSSVPEKTDD